METQIIPIQECVKRRQLRLHKQMQVAINTALKEMGKVYALKFDPFFDWEVGSITGNELLQEITYFIENDCLSPAMLKKDKETMHDFGGLIRKYKEVALMQHPSALVIETWNSIKQQLNARSGSRPDSRMSDGYDVFIKEETMPVLNRIFESKDWEIYVGPSDADDFTHRIAIGNKLLPESSQEAMVSLALQKLKEHFLEYDMPNRLQIIPVEEQLLIAGYLVCDPQQP